MNGNINFIQIGDAEADQERLELYKKYEKTKVKLLAKVTKEPSAKLYLKLANNEFSIDSDDINEKIQDQRISFLEKALALDSENVKIIEDLASSYNGDGDESKSLALYKKLVNISKKPSKYFFDLAGAYESNDDFEKALEYYVKFLIAKPNKYTSLTQEYIIDNCEALKIDPIPVLEDTLKHGENISTTVALYNLCLKKKQYKKATDYALDYFNNTDEQGHNYVRIAEKFFQKKLYAEAKVLFNAIDIKDYYVNELQILNYIGLCDLDHDYDAALKSFLRCYEIDKAEVAIHQNLYGIGQRFFNAQQYKKAQEVFEFCIHNFDYEKVEVQNYLTKIKT